MNQHAEQLGSGLLEVDFEFGLDLVDAHQREMISDGAMARNVEAPAHARDYEFVNVQDVGGFRGNNLQPTLQFRVVHLFFRFLDGGGLALDVGEDGCDFGHVVANVGLEFSDLIVGSLESHPFVQFDVLLDMKLAIEILHRDVVDVEIVASGNGADAIKGVFRTLGAGERLNRDIGIGQNSLDRCGDRREQLFGALESDGAGEANREIGKVAIAGAPDADATDFEHPLHARNFV